jgi:CBS domain containing-hemolysin-like protein
VLPTTESRVPTPGTWGTNQRNGGYTVDSGETLTLGAIGVRLGVVFLLVLFNGFFVAGEFSLVAARRSRLDQMAAEGDRRAKAARAAQDQLPRIISGTQLGVTLTSLALGWLGEPSVASLIDTGLRAIGVHASAGVEHTAAAVIVGFLVITFLHIVIGELGPKSISLANAEGVARIIAAPILLFVRFTSPFIWVLNGAANGLLKLFGVKPAPEGEQVHSPEELRLLVMQARAHGTLDESDSAMLAGVFDFHEKKAYDVMRPRTEVSALHVDASEDEVREVLRTERYSRYPVYRDSLDDVIGVFLAKDYWLRDGDTPFSLKDYLREPLYIPSTRAAERVLDDLRKTRAHLAVVLDEYGGTAGIVTMEDLVEEVVGDINDEYDLREREAFEFDGVLELAGSLSLVDVRSDYRLRVPDGDWTTLGGYVFGALGRLPKIGDRAPFPGGELEVVAMDGRRVAAVRVHRSAQPNGAA